MRSFEEVISELEEPIIKKTGGANSERAELLGEFLKGLTSKQSEDNRKILNWKRYVAWLKKNKIPDSEVARDEFRSSRKCIKEPDIGVVIWRLGHIKNLSVLRDFLKDCQNAKNFASHFFYHTRGYNSESSKGKEE